MYIVYYSPAWRHRSTYCHLGSFLVIGWVEWVEERGDIPWLWVKVSQTLGPGPPSATAPSHQPHHLLQHNYIHQCQGTLSNEHPPHPFATKIFLQTSSWRSFWAVWLKKRVAGVLCQSYHYSSRGMITSGNPKIHILNSYLFRWEVSLR